MNTATLTQGDWNTSQTCSARVNRHGTPGKSYGYVCMGKEKNFNNRKKMAWTDIIVSELALISLKGSTTLPYFVWKCLHTLRQSARAGDHRDVRTCTGSFWHPHLALPSIPQHSTFQLLRETEMHIACVTHTRACMKMFSCPRKPDRGFRSSSVKGHATVPFTETTWVL